MVASGILPLLANLRYATLQQAKSFCNRFHKNFSHFVGGHTAKTSGPDPRLISYLLARSARIAFGPLQSCPAFQYLQGSRRTRRTVLVAPYSMMRTRIFELSSVDRQIAVPLGRCPHSVLDALARLTLSSRSGHPSLCGRYRQFRRRFGCIDLAAVNRATTFASFPAE
jgi:hypothetical protein